MSDKQPALLFVALCFMAVVSLAGVMTWALMDIGMPPNFRRGVVLVVVLLILGIVAVLSE